ncbi:MAG: amidohydrolase family protein [Nitrospinae bacterium]|nr:amidohydrolase family protein [Nitrospinota bacterium]
MDTLVRAGLLYPVTAPPVESGWLLLRGGRIVRMGGGAPPGADEVMDFPGCLVMPGLVNAHCHLQFTAARGTMPRGDFMEWVAAVIAYSEKTSAGEIIRGVEEGMKELLAGGTTAVGDIFSDIAAATAVMRGPLRAALFAEAVAPQPARAAQAHDAAVKLAQSVAESGGRAGLSPHGPHTAAPALFSSLARHAGERGMPLMSHVAETPEERRFIEKGEGPFRALLRKRESLIDDFHGYGKSPVMLIREQGALRRLLAAHLNEVDEEDIAALAAAKAIPVFCPGSSRWFGRKKIMPLDRFIEAGLAPCLGTDSAASNNSLSMLDELRAAREYFPAVPPERLVEAATINGARALGLECGALEAGRWADIAVFPARGGLMLDALFTAGKASFVMVGGTALRNSA